MRRALLITLAIVVLLAISLPPAVFYYAAYSQPGLKLVLRFVPRRIGKTHIDFEGVRGTIAHGMSIARVEVDDTHVHLVFTGISGRLGLKALLLQQLHVPRLSIQHALIEVRRAPPGTPHRKPRRWHFLPHWLEIRADDVRLAAGTLIVPGRRFDATRLFAAGLVRPNTIRIDRIGMTFDKLEVGAHGRLGTGNPVKLDAAAHATIRPAHGPAWVIDADGKGALSDLAVAAHFSAPLSADLSGHALDLTHRWHWQGNAQIQSADLAAWGATGALGSLSGTLALTADAAGITARGPLTIPGLHAGTVQTRFEGGYSDRVITIRQLELAQSSGAALSVQGRIGIVPHGPRLDVKGQWTRFRWPLAGPRLAVSSASGRYTLEGMRPFGLTASGELTVRGLEPIGFDLEGALDDRGLSVRQAALRAFDGRAQIAGSIAWSPQVTWSAQGSAAGVSPVSLRRDLPGRVSFEFQADGSRIGKGADFSIAVRRLTGELRGLRARADGHIARRGGRWQLGGVQVALGRTALSVDGTVDDRLDLDFKLAADDLALIDPGITGRLEAQGMLRGPRQNPSIEASAHGSGMHYEALSLAKLDARVDFDPARGRALAHLEAQGVALGPRRLGNLTLAVDGPAGASRAALSLAGLGYRAHAAATGTLLDGAWRGDLTQLTVTGADARLALEAPAGIAVAPEAFHLDRLCLEGKPARMCADGDWTPHAWSVFALASGLPLELLTDGLTRGVQYRGHLALTAQLEAAERGPARGRLGVTLTDAEMVSASDAGRVERAQLGTGSLEVVAAPDRVDGALEMHGGAAGSLTGKWVVHRTTADWRAMPLEGALTVSAPLRAWAPLYTRSIDRVDGTADAKLALSGTLGTPLIDGALSLAGGELDLYQYNLELRNASLEARLRDTGIDFGGTARIGAGSASARGHLDWRAGAERGQFTLSGTNLRVVDIPEAQIDASPDLKFTLDGHALAITGTVKIPDAHIAPADLTNAVSVSPDQVIVGELSEESDGHLDVSTRLSIELGDRVQIATQGLTGRLTGSVVVTSGGGSITHASGELRIAGGQYSAYGRQLDIDRGRLIYAASPLDNPGIDIRAVKRFHDPNVGATVAGINVRGTLRQPQMTFFSEPPLAQQQIVSLVFAGGTLFGGPQLGASATQNSSRNENAQLIGQGAALVGSQIGLPVGIEPTYNNDTALMLGKYLSPRLYVSYGITLLQSLNIVKLRYTLGDHWALSTEFGQLGGADIVYTFQK
ncbi:MAG: translocation/assembly module TamB domain-containing protein [Steroidobacteraceae bacterium]